MPITVRAVVVTWNGIDLLPACLSSLAAQRLDGELEVVVVDNASTDGTDELLARDFPAVTVVRAERNLGFAGGVELGLRGLDADFALLLNNDATLEPDGVDRLVTCALAHPRAGAVTARVLLAPAADRDDVLVNSTGLEVTTAGTGQDRDWLATLGTESHAPDVFGFCGAAALLRRTALDQVGTFDAELFLYYEDTDLSWRLRSAGWVVRHEPSAVAHHRHAASSDVDSPLFRYYNTRNSLVVFGRHAPHRVVLRSWARQTAGWLLACARRGPGDPVVRARGRGLAHAFRRLPRTLRERRGLWRGSAVARRSVAALLVRRRSA
jgi:GT2 family glycosyltransferase